VRIESPKGAIEMAARNLDHGASGHGPSCWGWGEYDLRCNLNTSPRTIGGAG